jgi:hypothetical protein
MINKHRRLAIILVGGLALLTLAACGGSGSGTDGPAQAQPSGGASGQANGQRGQNGRNGGFPGVSGLIVALSGKTMQVRTSSGQSSVTYTTKTTVTEQTSAKAPDAKVGLCAVVRSADSSATGSDGTSLTAGSVSLSDEVDGSCQGGFGGGPRPSGLPSGRSDGQGAPPSGAPGDGTGGAPSGLPSRAFPSGGPRGGFGGASGKITKVDGSTLTIEQTRGTVKTAVAVTLTGDTTFTKQIASDTGAIAKGTCVFASGTSDSTGALSATALRLSAPVNGVCQLGGQGRRHPSGGQSSGG